MNRKSRRSRLATDFLRHWAVETPEAPAVLGLPGSDLGEPPVWSYRELDRWVDVVAHALMAGGVPLGGRVGVRLPPSPEVIVLLHAVLRAGAVFVPLHASWTDAEIVKGIAATGPPSLIVSTLGELVEWDGEGPPLEIPEQMIFPSVSLDSAAAILLTSGSTGAPRPITLSHRNLHASAEGVVRRLNLEPEDCWLASLSPGHVGGLALLHRAAAVGCSVLPVPRFDPAEVAELIEGGLVSHISLVPVMLDRLIRVRGDRPSPSTLRCLLVGGDHLPETLLERALALGYPVSTTYGMTEATSQISTARPEEVRRKPGSVGSSLDPIELAIEEPDERGMGEILVRGPTVVKGLPAGRQMGSKGRVPARDAAFQRQRTGDSPSVFVDAEGWLHTGDVGRMDPDGDLEVIGRLTDRIVTAGVTVEPGEIEEVLSRHPGVLEVAAVGIPDAEWGERVLVGVVPRNPAAPPSLDDLLAFSRERLAPAKRPRELRLLSQLPRNERGKVMRSRLI